MLLQWQSSGLFKKFSLIFFQAIQCSGLVPLSSHFWPHGHIFYTPVSLELELVKRQLSSFGHLTKIPPGCFLDKVFWVCFTRRRPQDRHTEEIASFGWLEKTLVYPLEDLKVVSRTPHVFNMGKMNAVCLQSFRNMCISFFC